MCAQVAFFFACSVSVLYASDVCYFSVVCGRYCLNRVTDQDCTEAICRVGPGCTNRRFENPTFPATAVFRTEGRGYGLRARETIDVNKFIIEYVGEVVSTSFYDVRRAQSGSTAIYGVKVTAEYVIDAEHAGNHARFINHSCAPNSSVVKRVCHGFTRLVVVADRQIAQDEEITINYKLSMPKGQTCNFVCKCMAVGCKGVA